MDVRYASLAYPPSLGGGEIHLHRLAQGVASRGHDVAVVTQWSHTRSDWLSGATLRCDTPRRYVHEGVPVAQLGFSRATRMKMVPAVFAYKQRWGRAAAIRRIAGLMQADFEGAVGQRPDLVHTLRIGREFLPTAALEYSRRVDVPLVVSALHHPNWTKPHHRHFELIYQAADAVIALTEFEKSLLVERKGVKPERVHVTGIGPVLGPDPDVPAFRARHSIEGPFALFIGRKVPHKGWRAMLEAAPQLFMRHPDVSLVFLGHDTEESRLAFDAAHGSRIHNLGPVDLETKTAALHACEFLCVPSTSESFGGVYTEAWACAKPVIAGDVPPLDEVVTRDVDGLLVEQQPGPLADAMGTLFTDSAMRARMGAAGLAKVRERYDWDRLADATLRVYASALGRRAPVADSMESTS